MTTPRNKQLRQYIRIPFSAPVELQLPEQTFQVHLVDIALKGALVQCTSDHTFKLQGKCRLVLPMADDGDGIVMDGHIIHLQSDLIGIECSDIDVTSLTRLRRLIQLNCGDTSLMDREIRHLFGPK